MIAWSVIIAYAVKHCIFSRICYTDICSAETAALVNSRHADTLYEFATNCNTE